MVNICLESFVDIDKVEEELTLQIFKSNNSNVEDTMSGLYIIVILWNCSNNILIEFFLNIVF